MPDQPIHRSDHAAHDRFLMAAFATDDLTGTELAEATELSGRCPDCAQLLADLRSIAAATGELPAPARVRDFRLTEEEARRLRPGGWRRLAGILAGPRLAFTQPLAAALTTIGIAGVLLFTIQGFGAGVAGTPTRLGAAPASAGAESQSGSGASAAASPAGTPAGATAQTGNYGPQPGQRAVPAASPATNPQAAGDQFSSGKTQDRSATHGAASPGEAASPSGAGSLTATTAPGQGPSPLLTISGLAVLVGLALFVIRLGARRLVA